MALLLAAALLPGSAGCLWVAAGAAAGGAAAAGYFYYKGTLYRDYPITVADGSVAVRKALTDLHFPIVQEERHDTDTVLTSRTLDGYTVRINLEVQPRQVPVDPPLTRISVRVGLAGDEAVSARILDQVHGYLVPGSVPPPPPPPVVTPASHVQVNETTPPPLAPIAVSTPAAGAMKP
jgi:hypothetical protein